MHDLAGLRALLRVPTAALAAVAVLGLALGCGSESSSPGEAAPAPPTAAATPDPEPAPQAPPAESAGEGVVTSGDLPPGYPEDLPIYPGAVAGTALGIPGGPMLVTFASQDPIDDILGHYRGELEQQGWSVTRGKGGQLEARKEGRTASIQVSRAAEGGSTIAVTLSEDEG